LIALPITALQHCTTSVPPAFVLQGVQLSLASSVCMCLAWHSVSVPVQGAGSFAVVKAEHVKFKFTSCHVWQAAMCAEAAYLLPAGQGSFRSGTQWDSPEQVACPGAISCR